MKSVPSSVFPGTSNLTPIRSINPSTGFTSSSTVTSLAQRTANGGAIEASAIFKFNNFYYLFTSWDNCCRGTSSTYNIRVGRSSSSVFTSILEMCLSLTIEYVSPTGGFVDKSGVALTNGGGTLVLGTHDNVRICCGRCKKAVLMFWVRLSGLVARTSCSTAMAQSSFIVSLYFSRPP